MTEPEIQDELERRFSALDKRYTSFPEMTEVEYMDEVVKIQLWANDVRTKPL